MSKNDTEKEDKTLVSTVKNNAQEIIKITTRIVTGMPTGKLLYGTFTGGG